MNREQYLSECVNALSNVFTNYTLPPVKVSCSWPGGGSARKRIGECWPRSSSKSGINEIFISPVIDTSVSAIEILVHELIHAIDDCKHGHRKQFTAIMRDVGLEGKPTATHAGERLHAELVKITDALGIYPHAKLAPVKPKQKSRQLKASCDDCSAVWRMSKQWLDKATCCPVCTSEYITIA